MTIIDKLKSLLSKKDYIALIYLSLFSIFVSAIEVFSIGIIMPFISISTDFNNIFKNDYFKNIYNFFNFESPVNFIVLFGICLIILYLFRAIINIIYFYELNKFSQNKYRIYAYKLFANYLGMQYIDFITKNTSYLLKTITNEAQNLVLIISSVLFIMSEIFVIIFIYCFLLYINWKVTLLLTLFLSLNILLLKQFMSSVIKNAGELRDKMQQKFYEVIISSFGNFKIIKLKDNAEDILNLFNKASVGFVRANIINQTLSHVPRIFLETMGFGLLSVSIIYLISKYQTDIKIALPVLSVLVLGLYRLIPSINRIYVSYNQILFYLRSIEIVYEDILYKPEPLGEADLEFNKFIKLVNVYFEYEPGKPILRDVNLTIKKGEKLGVIGETGSGKSTLIDLIIGLYRPVRGSILIDDEELTDNNLRAWRRKIGYIPQDIYLFDGTVAENVAFGENFDEERIKEVLKMANLLDFLEKNHQGIYTRVGENGVKLSGGQKQRVAIARALYNDPEVLVLDEATSALDIETEAKIMEEIYKIGKDKTMIIVAHRISTLAKCDRVVEIVNGTVRDGTNNGNVQV